MTSYLKVIFILMILMSGLLGCRSNIGNAESGIMGVNEDDHIIVVPVDLYLLSFSDMEEINSTYGRKELDSLFEEVNTIWGTAGISWKINSIENLFIGKDKFQKPENGFSKPREFRDSIKNVVTDINTGRWRLYIVKQFPVNGSALYLYSKGAVIYGEFNKLGKHYPVILAHEFGHSLGLPHVKFKNNLMYGGREKNPEKTLNLNYRQIKVARKQAKSGPFYMSD